MHLLFSLKRRNLEFKLTSRLAENPILIDVFIANKTECLKLMIDGCEAVVATLIRANRKRLSLGVKLFRE